MPTPCPGPRRAMLLVTIALAALAASCNERSEPGVGRGGPAKEAAMTTDSIPAGGGIEGQLLAADRLFCAEVTAARGGERARVWAGWFAPAGRQLVTAAVVTGPAEILALMEPAFADPDFSLVWDPDLADGAGTWGWTSGRYTSTRPGPDGPVRREGRYLTVWQRQADGRWQVAVDTGVPDDQ